tara:strand:+ start:78654 stop:79046 length:393 start_codon:yes stop_codon:yes gene_type:complete
MPKTSYSSKKLKFFKKSIEKKLEIATVDFDEIRDRLHNPNKSNASLSQESVYSVHMADAGTDSYEREKSFHLMNRESDYIKHLTNALKRIEDGSFGICTICKGKIPEDRMTEVPNATKCVTCKEKEKLNI